MAERKRGTQGRPMIYGKSPESRQYWNITPEETGDKTKTAAEGENQPQNEKRDTGKAVEGRAQEDQKSLRKDEKHADGRLHLHRKTDSLAGKQLSRRADTQQKPGKQAAGERRKRTRSHGEQKKLRALWMAFGILSVLLVVAIVYEIVLGNGTKLPGSERITQPTRQEQNKVTTGITLQKTQTEEVQTQTAAQAETEAQSEEVQTGAGQTEAFGTAKTATDIGVSS